MLNEDTRVKIPALVHLTRLGFKYVNQKTARETKDEETNILLDVFNESIARINNLDEQSERERERERTL